MIHSNTENHHRLLIQEIFLITMSDEKRYEESDRNLGINLVQKTSNIGEYQSQNTLKGETYNVKKKYVDKF